MKYNLKKLRKDPNLVLTTETITGEYDPMRGKLYSTMSLMKEGKLVCKICRFGQIKKCYDFAMTAYFVHDGIEYNTNFKEIQLYLKSMN